jgi:hypothetical protein
MPLPLKKKIKDRSILIRIKEGGRTNTGYCR